MVLEHRHRGGAGGEAETQREGEKRRDGRVESWTAVVPLDQTMMGLYYPAMLPVSSTPRTGRLCKNYFVHMLGIVQDQN